MVIAYVGLGSNLVQPLQQVQTAILELDGLPETCLLQHSSLYRSRPMGSIEQPDFINAVVKLETALAAERLLGELQGLEVLHQRVRKERWGPRTLDLDLLLYGDEVINSGSLIVPHPGLMERNFVLFPLFEIAPDLILPDNCSLVELVQSCSREDLQRLENLD